jgi:hypothetical protein
MAIANCEASATVADALKADVCSEKARYDAPNRPHRAFHPP